MKKETLEETSEKYIPKAKHWTIKDIFKAGAKWQQERMYSEEELREAIHESRIQDDTPEEYIFEQFKKKQL